MATTKKNVKKQSMSYAHGAYALALVVWAYILISLAIDNGSLIFYVFSFVSLYWAVHFAKRFFQKK